MLTVRKFGGLGGLNNHMTQKHSDNPENCQEENFVKLNTNIITSSIIATLDNMEKMNFVLRIFKGLILEKT